MPPPARRNEIERGLTEKGASSAIASRISWQRIRPVPGRPRILHGRRSRGLSASALEVFPGPTASNKARRVTLSPRRQDFALTHAKCVGDPEMRRLEVVQDPSLVRPCIVHGRRSRGLSASALEVFSGPTASNKARRVTLSPRRQARSPRSPTQNAWATRG